MIFIGWSIVRVITRLHAFHVDPWYYNTSVLEIVEMLSYTSPHVVILIQSVDQLSRTLVKYSFNEIV